MNKLEYLIIALVIGLIWLAISTLGCGGSGGETPDIADIAVHCKQCKCAPEEVKLPKSVMKSLGLNGSPDGYWISTEGEFDYPYKADVSIKGVVGALVKVNNELQSQIDLITEHLGIELKYHEEKTTTEPEHWEVIHGFPDMESAREFMEREVEGKEEIKPDMTLNASSGTKCSCCEGNAYYVCEPLGDYWLSEIKSWPKCPQ